MTLTLRNLFWLLAIVAYSTQTSTAAEPTGDGGEAANDAAILGCWRVVDATYCGEPLQEVVGAVYTFKAGGELEVYAVDYEARCEYRLDSKSTPKSLISYFFFPKLAGSGIYRLEGDKLTWRMADEEQKLRFTAQPAGKWNDYTLKRLNDEELKQAIQEIEQEKLRLMAAESDAE